MSEQLTIETSPEPPEGDSLIDDLALAEEMANAGDLGRTRAATARKKLEAWQRELRDGVYDDVSENKAHAGYRTVMEEAHAFTGDWKADKAEEAAKAEYLRIHQDAAARRIVDDSPEQVAVDS